MRCELCTRKLGIREIAHGIRYGTSDPQDEVFIPSRESAYTVICQHCGEMILRQIYDRLDKPYSTKLFNH